MLVIGKNPGYRNRLCRINEFRFRGGVYIGELLPTAYPYRRNRRQANISLIRAHVPGINERTLPDDAPSPPPHSGSELHRGNGVVGRGVRQSHAVMVPDAGAEDFKDPRSRRGAGHFGFVSKTVARQQPQEFGLV
jgi:hypothetical protein